VTTILAIDPGTEQSGWCYFRNGGVTLSGVMDNPGMLGRLSCQVVADVLAIEMITSQGMPVGQTTFETCVWIGRFKQAWPRPEEVLLIPRHAVKMHVCNHPRAKDSNIRQALIDKLGRVGTKADKGPLYGVTSHAWAAVAVAVTAAEQMRDPLSSKTKAA